MLACWPAQPIAASVLAPACLLAWRMQGHPFGCALLARASDDSRNASKYCSLAPLTLALPRPSLPQRHAVPAGKRAAPVPRPAAAPPAPLLMRACGGARAVRGLLPFDGGVLEAVGEGREVAGWAVEAAPLCRAVCSWQHRLQIPPHHVSHAASARAQPLLQAAGAGGGRRPIGRCPRLPACLSRQRVYD